jgi:hypothetical protein
LRKTIEAVTNLLVVKVKPFQNPFFLLLLNPNFQFSIFTHFLSSIIMSQSLNLIKEHASNPKLWLIVGIGLAGGIVVVSETRRRRRRRNTPKPDFGAFIERFELLPFPQPPPPASKQMLGSLNFAISDMLVP